VGEVATKDTDVKVDRLEATGRGMAHHSGEFTAAHHNGEGNGSPQRPVQLTSWPFALFKFSMIFNHLNFEIQNANHTDVQKYLTFVGRCIET
jgi:hypothetical protein